MLNEQQTSDLLIVVVAIGALFIVPQRVANGLQRIAGAIHRWQVRRALRRESW